MANKSLFASVFGKLVPKADVVNEAGGVAYALTPKQALAQYASTGCLNSTFYADASTQLQTLIELASQVEPDFVAKVALYSRSKGNMKDAPALLVALLSVLAPGLMAEVFDRVIDSPKMLRNFVQIMRSGQVGRKSLGTLPKRLVLQWLESRSDEQLFRGSVGASPSLADVIKMVHPKPNTASRKALYGYLVGKPFDVTALPELVKDFEAFKANPAMFKGSDLPDVPMDMLTSLPLEKGHWKALARKVSWQSLRMNLNTFARHGVFEDSGLVADIARRLKDENEITKARVFPYQLMAAFTNATEDVPAVLKNALQDAMEIAISNVPAVDGKVWVLPDVSGSMQSPVTGNRPGSTTKVRCVDVAALVAAAILRKNPDAEVLPFSDHVVPADLNPRDSVMTNAQRLASLPSGGTNCSAPLRALNERRAAGDLVIYVSDNESWVDSTGAPGVRRSTGTLGEWREFKRRNPRAKLVCLDVQPYGSTQAQGAEDILNIGGFADSVFSVISEFNNKALGPDHWVSVIEKESI
ncbi:MAG: TROVE domain-containing protein [Phycisphaerales bacterium]|nr:TROVE domain-containing protein [Phycisphaerales bacterium]